MLSQNLRSLRLSALLLLGLSFFSWSAVAETLQFADGLTVQATFSQGPKVGVESQMTLQLATKDPSALAPQIRVELWMPSMGHGSRPTSTVQSVDGAGVAVAGRYEVSKMFFVMGGEWEVRVHLVTQNGQKETQSFLVKLAGGHH